MHIQFVSGSLRDGIEIPEKNLLAVLEPPVTHLTSEGTEELIKNAIENPVKSQTLNMLIDSKSRVAIVVDDITRPTPTKQILEILFPKLYLLGVKEDRINITIANGLHRKTTVQEKAMIVGQDILKRISVSDSRAREKQCFTSLGSTRKGTPIHINKKVADADLIITIGMIKSHSFAGFTGGAKSILPGVSSAESILRNHRFDFIEYPKGILGDAEMSFPRKDMEDACDRLPIFMINVVLDGDKKVFGAVAGDIVHAHRKGVALFKSSAEVNVSEPADVVVVEGSFPSSESLYFSLSNLAGIMSTKKPVIRKGGTVILLSQCREGVGAKIVEDLFPLFDSPKKILAHIKENDGVEEQWAAQHLASYLSEANILLVTNGIKKEVVELLKIKYFNTIKDALNCAFDLHGNDMKILVVKKVDSMIANAV